MAPKKQKGQEMGIIEKLSGYLVNPFKGPPPRKPVTLGERFKNIGNNNFRGLVGSIVPLILIIALWEKDEEIRKLELMWVWMFWFYLWQPVAVPNTSLIPVFFLPMAGIMSTAMTAGCYMNDIVMLFVLTSWLIVLLNNSGVDKRIALWFLASGETSQFSADKLVFKVSSAAFFLSMFSSRLIATLNLTELVTSACIKIDPSGKISDVTNLRYVINNAVQTSSSIGGIAIIHSSYVTLLFRGCFHQYVVDKTQWPDIFNYLTYTAFAFPVAFVMFIVNLGYHTVLVRKVGKGFTEAQKKEIQNVFTRNKAEIPKAMSLHEIISVVFTAAFLGVCFFRWVPAFGFGWADFSEKIKGLPGVKDATVAAIFVIVLHIIPKSYGFIKIFTVKKKSELNLKPESGILWWRFIDKNCNYGYIFTFGAAFAIITCGKHTHMDRELSWSVKDLTEMNFKIGILIAVFVAAILCNLMTAMAACSMWLPFVLAMSIEAPFPWPTKVYLAALGVGIASNFGFCAPFQYTPAYYCHHAGKVPLKMMIKYSVVPVLYCTIILYIFLTFVAEMIWDQDATGFTAIMSVIEVPNEPLPSPPVPPPP